MLAMVKGKTSNSSQEDGQSADNHDTNSSAVNVSFEKIMNLSFETYDRPVTRSQTTETEFCSKSNMIVNKHLLVKALKRAAVCRVCRNYKSNLEIKTIVKWAC